MAEVSTATYCSVDSTELDSFMIKNPSTAAIRGDSDNQDVDVENQRCCNSQRIIVAIIVLLGIMCLIIGIVLISLANDKHRDECDEKQEKSHQKNQTQNANSDACAPSEEAVRVSLHKLLENIQFESYVLNPNLLYFKPGKTPEEIRRNFKPYDPTPSEIKRRTDGAWRLLTEINETDIDLAKLKPRERKAVSQVKFYLRHVFGHPYDGNYYSGDWMLGPNFFCWQPICMLGNEISGNLQHFAPRNLSDMEVIRNILKAYNKSISQYTQNVKLGVTTGMIGSIEECRAGIDSLKEHFSHIYIQKEGVLKELFVQKLLHSSFYGGLTKEMRDEWKKRTGKTVESSMEEFLIQFFGAPMNGLFRYLENEHMQHCVPSNISSGFFNRPLKYVYINGTPDMSQPTVRNLSTGEILNGPQTYTSILSYFITTDMTPDEVYKKGWEMVNQTYPQILALARNLTGKKRDSDATVVEEFKKRITAQDMFYNQEPLPANESNQLAFERCSTIEGAKEFCPKRWEALQNWFKASREAMSFLEPKTVNMFHFTGAKQTTPSCPVQLAPDFNPSSAAQSYTNSDADCSRNCRYQVPFFLENMGPVFSEWSVNAHEARPGHHTQAQGFVEHFTDKCGGVIGWVNQISQSMAFVEGWGLYAEILIAEDTDSYDNKPWQRYGALKWRLWRALRLVLDVGLHSKSMTRREGLDLLANYAWDTSDIASKEMTRYQSGPGQASAYMIGQLMIQKLRDYAEMKLQEKFDLKEFHYQILNQGSAPLSFLESHITQYIACKLDNKSPGCKLILQPISVEVKTKRKSHAENQLSSEYSGYFNRPFPRRLYV
ncbi:uncharacterized protein LOC111321704 [Stylophora pistillata]|uniref:Uncharacterized protein n=1 Tax=Stylophora pistillata TaxID=50429 RepID=A0A2B4SRP0_STYPI|nr:uncharacterized protein LOC111321704 [Stylophora pistillata]PFX31789.1 hypothetical protein AWC38_SpisGene3401 [Stylophora pistillata]